MTRSILTFSLSDKSSSHHLVTTLLYSTKSILVHNPLAAILLQFEIRSFMILDLEDVRGLTVLELIQPILMLGRSLRERLEPPLGFLGLRPQ